MTSSLAEQVAAYVLSAMLSWVPLKNQIEREHDGRWVRDAHGYFVTEDEAVARARYERIAHEMVSVAFDEKNPPLYKGSSDFDGRLKTALAFASVGSFEGGYHKWVENGDCNSPEFQRRQKDRRNPECDGGLAWSNWQIHMYRYVIRDGEMTQAQYLENSLIAADRDWIKEHKDVIIRGPDIVKDPRLAVEVAYYLMRYSTKNFRSLCAYTGEDCDGRHPKALERLERAAAYQRSHPFVPETPVPADLIDQQILDIMAGMRVPNPSVMRAFTASRSVFAMAVPQIRLN